jgi:dolichol-phosphate mannosyltransferase
VIAHRVLVAVPVFNESAAVDRVLDAVRPYAHDLLFVDDGSTDGTTDRLAARGAWAIRHPRNLGYGAAMQTILRTASEHGFDWVIAMDCDEQHEPGSIPDFMQSIRAGDADVVSGSRYLRPSGRDDDAPADRRSINATLTREINELLGDVRADDGSRVFRTPMTDAFCGFKAYRTRKTSRLALDVTGYDFPMQFWVQAAAHGLVVREVPVPRIYLDPKRSFGAVLDDPTHRLAVYRATMRRELERCATALEARRAEVA